MIQTTGWDALLVWVRQTDTSLDVRVGVVPLLVLGWAAYLCVRWVHQRATRN